MKNEKGTIKNIVKSRAGMTLVEVLVAMTLLMLIILTFLPLFTSYYKNIRTAGEISKTSYEKASLIERLLANKGENSDGYETSAGDVPLIMTLSDGSGTLDFSSGSYGDVSGKVVSTNQGASSSYVTFYTSSNTTNMVCFPSSLTDDFDETTVMVVPKGFSFKGTKAETSSSGSGDHFVVFYTDSTGNQKPLDEKYYKIEFQKDGDDYVAEFTFYGGNDYVSFETSPLVIKYGSGDTSQYREVELEIGAPEIILVGEKSKGKYYYYSTSGVNDDGTMTVIAKEMSGTAALTSAMNDVEWVAEGEGDDGGDENGNVGVNKYGYYVMGGDDGQVRRFWKNDATGNYYWGGDNLTQYQSYNEMHTASNDSGTEQHLNVMTRTLTTTASFEVLYKSRAGYKDMIALLTYDSGYNYRIYASNYGTVTAKETSGITPWFAIDGTIRYNDGTSTQAYYRDKTEMKSVSNFLSGSTTYADLTGDTSSNPITITSVAAISLAHSTNMLSDNVKVAVAYESDDNPSYPHYTDESMEAYPQASYTLYCGTIPAYMDLIGRKFDKSIYTYLATLGIGFNSNNSSYGLTGIFGDNTVGEYTTKFGKTLNVTNLLNYKENITSGIIWGGEKTITGGSLLMNYNQSKGVTSGKVVDITIGYLSQPFANSTQGLATNGGENTKNYFSDDKYNHTFFGAATRDFSTFLDVASYYDDTKKASFSVAVGYGLGILASDADGYTRLAEVYNIGTIYLRAAGNGEGDNDTWDNQLESGKGWSLMQETNVFHPFYGIDQYAEGDDRTSLWDSSGDRVMSKVTYDNDGNNPCSAHGWLDKYHKQYFNLNENSSDEPEMTLEYSHILAQTECTSVDCGVTDYSFPEFMVGTSNGTVMSWYNDGVYLDVDSLSSKKKDSKTPNKTSRAMTKEFENYQWYETLGYKESSNGGNYDYWSTVDGTTATYGFISSLTKINDVQYSEGFWVAAGTQSDRAPKDLSAENAYTDEGNEGSYVNVRYSYTKDDGVHYAWKAVKISSGKYSNKNAVNIVSITCSNGVWYAMGYIDSNSNGECDSDEQGVIYYAKDPTKSCDDESGDGWTLGATTAKVYKGNGEFDEITLGGLNSMASQG